MGGLTYNIKPIADMVCLFPARVPMKIFRDLDILPREDQLKLVWHVEYWIDNNHEYGPAWEKYNWVFEEHELDKAMNKFNELVEKHPKAKIQLLGMQP